MSAMSLRISILLAIALLLIPLSSSAELAKWNQERVAKLANDFATQADLVQNAFRALDSPPPGAPRASFYRLKEAIRVVRNSADFLASRLKNGASQAETLPTFKRLMMNVRSVVEESRRAGMIPNDVLTKITNAGGTLHLLQPYYDPDWKAGSRK